MTDLETVLRDMPTLGDDELEKLLFEAVHPLLLLSFFRVDTYDKITKRLTSGPSSTDVAKIRVAIMRLTMIATASIEDKEDLNGRLLDDIYHTIGEDRPLRNGTGMSDHVGILGGISSLEYTILFIYLVMGSENINQSEGGQHE